jgi:hypothetical protein
MLHFVQGKAVVVLLHSLVKEREVPPKEIDKAAERKRNLGANPKQHTHEET